MPSWQHIRMICWMHQKLLTDETGLFGKISDKSIEARAGQTYTNARMMADPLAGLHVPVRTGEEWEEQDDETDTTT